MIFFSLLTDFNNNEFLDVIFKVSQHFKKKFHYELMGLTAFHMFYSNVLIVLIEN